MTGMAVVTGAASGLGAAIVAELVGRGMRVIGVDLPGVERAAAVEAAGATFVGCDVSDRQSWAEAATAIASSTDGVTLLALNAGVMTRSPRDTIADDVWSYVGSEAARRVFAVNVDGVLFGLAALRGQLSTGATVIVTSSVAGLSPLPFDPYYSMSKHAVIGLVRSVAPLLAPDGVRIHAYCPRGVDTAIVPDAIRSSANGTTLVPAGVVARALLSLEDHDSTGETWVMGAGDALADRYESPPIPLPSPRYVSTS